MALVDQMDSLKGTAVEAEDSWVDRWREDIPKEVVRKHLED